MKRPTVASLKKVTTENLAGLGAERLAEILVAVADARPELKRRLRMELAAEQGADHLLVEIDKRLGSLASSGSKVSWRARATFVRDLDGLRGLIAGRLSQLDAEAALDRMWRFMALARPVSRRVRDRDGELAAVFARAAGDLGGLLRQSEPITAAAGLVEAMVDEPARWAAWLPHALESADRPLAQAALRAISERSGAVAGWIPLIRLLADRAGDVDAFRATFTRDALKAPPAAAEMARRLLAASRIDEAGEVLQGAGPARAKGGLWPGARAKPGEADFEWETVWIDYLAASGQTGAAQAARWASFERTLSVERARAFTRDLTDFEDVEAETRAFEHAARHADFARGLRFLMEWPALPEAARMIQARADEVVAPEEEAELWAAQLRRRHPAAAHTLLRKAAAAAFRRRDYATCDRLTNEADAIPL